MSPRSFFFSETLVYGLVVELALGFFVVVGLGPEDYPTPFVGWNDERGGS